MNTHQLWNRMQVDDRSPAPVYRERPASAKRMLKHARATLALDGNMASGSNPFRNTSADAAITRPDLAWYE